MQENEEEEQEHTVDKIENNHLAQELLPLHENIQPQRNLLKKQDSPLPHSASFLALEQSKIKHQFKSREILKMRPKSLTGKNSETQNTPRHWQYREKHIELFMPEIKKAPARIDDFTFCAICKKPKPPRAHHCKRCDRCILRMDHHCQWIGNCIGFNNHKYFLLSLIYSSILLVFSIYMIVACLIKHHQVFYDF